MHITELISFLSQYDLQVAIVAVVTALIVSLIGIIVKKEIPPFIKTYSPFFLGVILHFIFGAALRGFYVGLIRQSLSAGLLSGALSAVVYTAISNLKKADEYADIEQGAKEYVLLSESVLSVLVDSDNLKDAATETGKLLYESLNDEDFALVLAVKESVKKYVLESIDDQAINGVAERLVRYAKII